MKNIILIVILFLLLSFNLHSQSSPMQISDSTYIWLTTGQYEKIELQFDSSLLDKVSAFSDQLSDMWKSFTKQYGAFQYITDYAELDSNNGILIVRNIIFEKDSIGIKVNVNNSSKIIGLFVVQPIVLNYKDADYVNISKFNEIDVAFAEFKNITGKITIPNNIIKGKKVPCVILVHGSGPSDLDESAVGRKPFRDIAFGLSSNGVAVLRYNKRTYLNKNIDVNTATLNEETINDAISAAEFVKNNYSDKIDKIYILGHSLGGYAMPRIAKNSKIASGFILLAGSARSLAELIKEQYLYLNDIFGIDSNVLHSTIKKCDLVLSGNFTKDTPSDSLPFGLTATYLLDLKNYNPVKEFQSEHRPALFIQGGRDYQVTKKDFDLWKSGLSENKNCNFILIDELNHLMQEGEGRSVPSEYSEQKNVSIKVINNILKWLSN